MIRLAYKSGLALLSVVVLSTPAVADIVFTGGQLESWVQDAAYTASPIIALEGMPTMPYYLTHDMVDHDSTVHTVFDFSGVGDAGEFDFQFDHVRAEYHESSAGDDGKLYFTVGADVPYDLSGAYGLTGTGYFQQTVTLYDETGSAVLFYQDQLTTTTPNASYVLGTDGGFGAPIGSLTGTLIAGNTYSLSYAYFVYQDAYTTGTAAATGFLNLKIQPIPAPAAVVLGALGLGTVGCIRRRLS